MPTARLVVANARAITLFTASDEDSESRRGRVRMNKSVLTSALSGGAMAPTGEPRELQLANPLDGSELRFELLSTVTADPRHGTVVVSILRHISEQRRAGEDIEQQNRELQLANEQLEASCPKSSIDKIQAATGDIARQNELLRRQAIELEQASALKSQFLANMSHEFRTPLNAMLGYTSMLLQGVSGPLNDAAKRQLGRVESNGRHLLTIINEILDISRIEAGRMPLQISTFRIPVLMTEVRAELEPVIMTHQADGDARRVPRGRTHHQRPSEGEADRPQPVEQRAEVHPRRRRDLEGASIPERKSGPAVSVRHRHRHRACRSGENLRRLPPA